MHTAGETDVHGIRLVCTFAIATSQETSTSIGERLLQVGLSYPLPGAPTTYTAAFRKAQVSSSGVFHIFPPLSGHHAPASPKPAYWTTSQSVQLVHDGQVYKVIGRSELRDASHALVWTSRTAFPVLKKRRPTTRVNRVV